jgi:hypothetical protein
MKTMTLSRLQFLLLNTSNERQKEALEAAIASYSSHNDTDGQTLKIA